MSCVLRAGGWSRQKIQTPRGLARKEICRFHVRTGEPSNSSIFLDLSVAKCPLEGNPEQNENEVENVQDFWSMRGDVIRRHHEYIILHSFFKTSMS